MQCAEYRQSVSSRQAHAGVKTNEPRGVDKTLQIAAFLCVGQPRHTHTQNAGLLVGKASIVYGLNVLIGTVLCFNFKPIVLRHWPLLRKDKQSSWQRDRQSGSLVQQSCIQQAERIAIAVDKGKRPL